MDSAEDIAAALADIAAALAEDVPLLHRAGEIMAVAVRFPRRHAGSIATLVGAVSSTAVTSITAVAGTTAAVDIMAPVLDSVWVFTRHTDMPLPSAILLDSMTSTATGNTIPVARFRTVIKEHRAAVRLVRRGSVSYTQWT